MWNLPKPGIKSVSLHWLVDSHPRYHQGSPTISLLSSPFSMPQSSYSFPNREFSFLCFLVTFSTIPGGDRGGHREMCLLELLIKLNFANQKATSPRGKLYHCLWAEAAVSNCVLSRGHFSLTCLVKNKKLTCMEKQVRWWAWTRQIWPRTIQIKPIFRDQLAPKGIYHHLPLCQPLRVLFFELSLAPLVEASTEWANLRPKL